MATIFDHELYQCLVDAGVRKDTLDKLEEDELCTLDILLSTSEELLKACGIKGGQAIMVKRGVKNFAAENVESDQGAWTEAIRYRFNNIRKTKRPSVEENTPSGEDVEKVIKQPQAKKAKGPLPQFPPGETEETCLEHVSSMKREMLKVSNKNLVLVGDLMNLTYPYRRQRIIGELVSVKELLSKYPALQLVSEFKLEFGRVVGDEDIVMTMVEKFAEKCQENILKLAKTKPMSAVKKLINEAEQQILRDGEKKSVVEEAAAVTVLQHLLRDRGNSPREIVKICSND